MEDGEWRADTLRHPRSSILYPRSSPLQSFPRLHRDAIGRPLVRAGRIPEGSGDDISRLVMHAEPDQPRASADVGGIVIDARDDALLRKARCLGLRGYAVCPYG